VTRRRTQRGQALAETAIVIVLLVTMAMGIIEFGRAWLIANMITHAARDGARMAAVPASNRDGSGMITDTSAIVNQVLSDIGTVVPTSGFTVSVGQTAIGGIPMVQVTVTGAVNYVFNLVGTSFTVNRTVTFRDEGR
jgi:Flp pilus assembly protein TadG